MEQSAHITAITIENFKGISKPVTVSLRPITLLFGKNSAGKSTILQAMLYALEIIRTGNVDIDKVQLCGDAISLGGFGNLVHKHDLSRTIRLRFDLQLGQFGLESFRLYDGHYEDLEDDALGNVKTAYVELELSAPNSQPQISRYSVGIEGEPIASIVRLGKFSAITHVNPANPIFGNRDDSLLSDVMDSLTNAAGVGYVEGQEYDNEAGDGSGAGYGDGSSDGSGRGSGAGNIDGSGFGYPQYQFVLSNFDGVIPRLNEPLEIQDTSEESNPSEQSQTPLELFFSRCLIRPVGILKGQLEQIRYIGPIRDIPLRNHEAPIAGEESRWANGLAAWDALYSANESPLQKENFMAGSVIPRLNSCDAKMIAESEQFTLQKVNEYICDVLQLGYELRRDDVIEIDVNGSIMNTLRKAALQFEEIDEQQLRNAILNGLEKQPVKKRLALHDLNNDVDVSPCDIGVGVSQVVPVVVGALAKTAENKFPSILSIEQPELHIHPAVQCALGDLFIREKSDSRVFLLETHSEHLILRFLRRISETTDNELKDQSLALRPDELGVIYVNTANNELTLTELPVDNDGEFTTRWPEGFFEERATELFGEPDA